MIAKPSNCTIAFVSTNPDDRAFDNRTYSQSATEYLGKLPDDQFQDEARNAYNQAAPQDRQGLLGGLLARLQAAPREMSPASSASRPVIPAR